MIPAYTVTHRPTMRKNGHKMYDMAVTHPIGVDDLAWAIFSDFNNDPSKCTRTHVFNAVACNLLYKGTDYWDDVDEDKVIEAYRICKILFPELEEATLETKTRP